MFGENGLLHENPVETYVEEQAYRIDRAGEVIGRATGKSSRGYRVPLYIFTDQAARRLVERGSAYVSSRMADDVPNPVKAAGAVSSNCRRIETRTTGRSTCSRWTSTT